MFYIADKFGFVSDIVADVDVDGNPCVSARHCVDVREAKPFKRYASAISAYKRTKNGTWWHAVLSSDYIACPE